MCHAHPAGLQCRVVVTALDRQLKLNLPNGRSRGPIRVQGLPVEAIEGADVTLRKHHLSARPAGPVHGVDDLQRLAALLARHQGLAASGDGVAEIQELALEGL